MPFIINKTNRQKKFTCEIRHRKPETINWRVVFYDIYHQKIEKIKPFLYFYLDC